jgi:hypothetical protein
MSEPQLHILAYLLNITNNREIQTLTDYGLCTVGDLFNARMHVRNNKLLFEYKYPNLHPNTIRACTHYVLY